MTKRNDIKIYSIGCIGGPTNIRKLLQFMEDRRSESMGYKFKEYRNDITEYIDSFIPEDVINIIKDNDFFRVYLLDCDNNSYGIRYPGFTTGYINTDESGIITGIGLYRDTKSTEMFSAISDKMLQEKFIGTKLDLSKRRK